jgi:tetratricopeptide (TPR) repeat protein
MKKTIILLALIFVASFTFAQKGKVTSASTFKESGKLDKALETSNLTVNPDNEKAEKSIPWPRTWEVRGEIFQAIFQSKDENYKKLDSDPLTKALASYKKAIELDTKDKYGKSLKIKFTLLTSDLTNQAIQAFNDDNYKLALQSFEQILELNDVPVMKADNPGMIDTVILFNAGLAAYNAKDYDKAIKYYKEVATHNYNEGRTYVLIASTYELKQDTVNALTTLQEGFEKYPEDTQILVKMINIYLNTNKTDEAMKYLDLAIKKDPENASFYFAQGTLFDRIEQPDGAIKSYEAAIELNEDYFDANYNLGALYYNKGVKQIEIANALPSNISVENYTAEKDKANIWFDKSLPYMERCHVINNKDVPTLESLKNLYYRLMSKDSEKWDPKYREIEEQLNNL